MKSIISFFVLFLSFTYTHSESTNSQNKNLISTKFLQPGLEVLQDKNIKIVLPTESGFRKDLYDSNGNLLQSEYYNIEGNLIESESKVAIEKRNYNSIGFLEKVLTLDKNKNISSILFFAYDTSCLQIKKDEACVSEVTFMDGADNPVENEEGIHKYKTEFDKSCLQNEKRKPLDCKKLEIKLNKKLKPVEDKDGNAKIYRTFDSFGNLNLYEIYDRFGKIKHKVIYAYDYKCIELTNKPQGCIIFQEYSNRIEKEEKGNLKTTNYGKRILTYDLNCIQEKQNSEKCISLEENYDLNGKLQDISHRFTFGCMDYSLELGAYAKKISNFDKKGNEILREFYNSKNQLIEDSSGGAKYVYSYNQECLDNGHKTQYCRTLSEIYDKNLKLKYKAIYNETCLKTGKAILESPNYCTAWKETYDSMEVGGKPKDKIQIIKANFDSNGFKMNLEKYNINRELSLKTIYYFDKEKLIKKENQDANGNRTEDTDGIATYTYKYKHEKYTTQEETYGQDGNLKENQEGIAKMVFAYNDNCLKKKQNRYDCSSLEEFYDSKGNLVELKANIEDTHSYAKLVREFDVNGNLVQEAYFDKNHNPKKNQKGIAKYNFFYDEMGELIEEDQYGKKSNLKQKILYTYDSLCKSISKDFSCNTSITHLDKKNSLLDKEKLDGVSYAKEITTYNHACVKITSDPDECQEKKEYINSKQEIIYAEYFKYFDPPTPQSEIKFIKLTLTQDKIPVSAEFIK